jgi:hypothetical protein
VLEMVRGARIVGRVKDHRGAHLAAATVRCLMPGRDDLAVITERLPMAAEAAALPGATGHVVGRSRSVVTDSSGRFELGDMLPGRFRLEVGHPGSVSLRTDFFVLAPGQKLDAGVISLREGIRLTGRVVDENGMAVEGARVIALATVAAAPTAKAGGAAAARAAPLGVPVVGVTDRGGEFGIALPDGAHQLTVSAPGMLDQVLVVPVPPSGPPAPLLVRLARADGALEGLIRDTGGRPLARAQVLAWSPSGSGDDALQELKRVRDEGAPLARTITDPGGHFQLSRLPRRPVLIEVRHPQYPRTAQLATPGAQSSISISVAIPGGIEGEVREKVTGAVIANYQLEAQGPAGADAPPSRKKGAGFVITPLTPGQWKLAVRAPGFAPGEHTVQVPPSSNLGETSVRDLRIELHSAPSAR